MRILLLASAFNGLTQRLHRELAMRKHAVSVELAVSPQAMEEAAALFRPDLIVCPFLKQRVPDSIWKHHQCLIVHPGIEGDRGPSSLDWAIQRDEPQWGVTLLQAAQEMDAGDIWGTSTFAMRGAAKSSIYRREVSEHAVRLVLEALDQVKSRRFRPRSLNYENPLVTGRWNRPMLQADRTIDWGADTSARIIRRVNAADGAPGVLDEVAGQPVYVYGARRARGLEGRPGALLARSHGAICRASVDGAVWFSHLRPAEPGPGKAFKLPAEAVLGKAVATLPHIETDGIGAPEVGCNEIRYYEIGAVGYLHFDFYNGAMSSTQCRRLQDVYAQARRRPIKVIALMGGEEFFSTGIHLNCIEAAASPADESWANINAMNDLVEEILKTEKQLTVAVVRSNAGAGGAVLATACDQVWIRRGVVLNVHYQTMGLYGSEYWTYLLPRRVGARNAQSLTEDCLPTLANEAHDMGLADRLLPEDWSECHRQIDELCVELADTSQWRKLLAAKGKALARDERTKPLQTYRDEELRHMYRAFYEPNSAYHEARRKFVGKQPADRTPAHIAVHRATDVRKMA